MRRKKQVENQQRQEDEKRREQREYEQRRKLKEEAERRAKEDEDLRQKAKRPKIDTANASTSANPITFSGATNSSAHASTLSFVTNYNQISRPVVANAERQIINDSVQPCVPGRVDRTCLTGSERLYVADKVDSALYGTLKEQLGEGSYGKVYKTNKGFAIKCLTQSPDSTDLRPNDMREMCLLRNLIHPNIVFARQVAIGNATFDLQCKNAVVLDLFDGPLNRLSKEKLKRQDTRAFIMYQVVRAVAFLHSRNIMHRDIKPGNFLVHISTNRVVMADFGTAQGLAVIGNRYSPRVTTSWYRAPELFAGKNVERYSAATDVWSLGISWLDILGIHYFNLDDEIHVYNVIKSLIGVSNPVIDWKNDLRQKSQEYHIEESEIDLISKMLNPKPEERITAFAALNNHYFDKVRNSVNRRFPTPHILPPTYANCGAMLVAMQTEPVGNYFRNNEEKILMQKVLKSSYDFIVGKEFRQSLFYLAASYCHRYLKLNKDANYHLIMATCARIAWEFDADYDINHSFGLSKVVEYLTNENVKFSENDVLSMENLIIKTLDMDFDRPTPFTFIEFLASYRVIGEETYKKVTYSLKNNYLSLAMLNKTAIEQALISLEQQSISTPCRTAIEQIYPEFAKRV